MQTMGGKPVSVGIGVGKYAVLYEHWRHDDEIAYCCFTFIPDQAATLEMYAAELR